MVPIEAMQNAYIWFHENKQHVHKSIHESSFRLGNAHHHHHQNQPYTFIDQDVNRNWYAIHNVHLLKESFAQRTGHSLQRTAII